jgi:hypothetical protein
MQQAFWGMTTFDGVVGCRPSMPMVKVVALPANTPIGNFTRCT